MSQPVEQSPEVTALERAAHARMCHLCGTLTGVVFGILDAWSAQLMGFDVTLNGQPANHWQVIFHAVLFGALGFAFGRLWDRRAQMQKAASIIQRQYEDLKANQQHLIQSEKLAVIGSLSASIAHEIRNPLGIMRSSAGLISEDLAPEHPGQKPLEFIRDEIDRLSGLIEGLLVFAKPKQPLLARADVNGLLERSMDFMAAEFRKRRIEIRRELSARLPEAYVDPDQIHQVFLGLLLNSMQAVQEDGTIVVKTSVFRDPSSGADRVRIHVSDSGKGIPAEHLEKIFEPFFTTKQEGTGLGLAVARQIITGHGGQIAASSPPGQGAQFEIVLPLPQVAAIA